MRWGRLLFRTALASLFVMVVLALSLAWFIPPHLLNVPGYIEYNKQDTAQDAWVKCNCSAVSNDSKPVTGNNVSVPVSWNNFSIPKVVITFVMRNETANWIDPFTREIIAQDANGSTWDYPSVVSVLVRKYVEDYDNTLLDFGGTGLIIEDSLVIAGASCFRTIKECGVNRPPAHCIQMIRIRSRSLYWSMGGQLRNITNYFVGPRRQIVIFKVQSRFVKPHEKPVKYPQPYRAEFKWPGGYSLYSFTGFYNRFERWDKKYRMVYSQLACGELICGIQDPRSKFLFAADGHLLFRPVITTCNELAGFETDDGSQLDINQEQYLHWISDRIGHRVNQPPTKRFKMQGGGYYSGCHGHPKC